MWHWSWTSSICGMCAWRKTERNECLVLIKTLFRSAGSAISLRKQWILPVLDVAVKGAFYTQDCILRYVDLKIQTNQVFKCSLQPKAKELKWSTSLLLGILNAFSYRTEKNIYVEDEKQTKFIWSLNTAATFVVQAKECLFFHYFLITLSM